MRKRPMKDDPKPSITRTRRMLRWALELCDICFFASLVSVFLSWLLNPFTLKLGTIVDLKISWGLKPFIAMAVFSGLHVFFKRYSNEGGLLGKKWFQGLTLATGVTILTLITVEGVLAYIPFQVEETTPIVIKGQGDDNSSIKNNDSTIGDIELRWRYLPGGTFWGLEVNNLGYLDRKVSIVKPPGTVRVICMGDSVTSQGPPPYSRYLHDRLTSDPPDNRQWEAFNMGVVGYSSVQGLRVFQKQGKYLQPDYVTLYFGWNDHWKSGLKPDSDIMAVPLNAWQAELARGLSTRRVGKLVLNVWQAWRRGPTSDERKGVKPWDLNRVPPDEYATTLKRFIDEIRSVGAVPILITAPRAKTLTELLVHNQQVVSVEDAIRQHDMYVEITRKVAAANNAPLLDLAAEMQGPDHAQLFSDDGIHMTYPGLEYIAAAIDAKLRSMVRH